MILSKSFGMLLSFKANIFIGLSKNRFPKDERLNVNKEIGINETFFRTFSQMIHTDFLLTFVYFWDIIF